MAKNDLLSNYTDAEMLEIGRSELQWAEGCPFACSVNKNDHPLIKRIGKKQRIRHMAGRIDVFYDIYAEMKDGTRKYFREIGPYKYKPRGPFADPERGRAMRQAAAAEACLTERAIAAALGFFGKNSNNTGK